MALPTKVAFSRLTATEYNAIVAEITTPGWLTLPLVNGWTGTLRYRKLLVPGNTVQLSGTIVAGTKTNGTTVGTLPVGWRPIVSQDVSVSCDTLTTGGQAPHANILTTGAINCWGVGAASGMAFNGFFALD
jgi:hypothetical protein